MTYFPQRNQCCNINPNKMFLLQYLFLISCNYLPTCWFPQENSYQPEEISKSNSKELMFGKIRKHWYRCSMGFLNSSHVDLNYNDKVTCYFDNFFGYQMTDKYNQIPKRGR